MLLISKKYALIILHSNEKDNNDGQQCLNFEW